MAAEGSHLAAGSQQVQQPPNREAPTSTGPQSVLPHPSRLELSSWWKKFRKSTEKSEDKSEQFYTSCCTYTYDENLQTVPSHLRHSQFSFLSPSQSRLRSASIRPVQKRILKYLLGRIAPGIFGVPLAESIRYANVAISLTNEQGESFIYGYVPIVVAKCGVFLKEKATDVEGIFRLSGSAKRIKDLQAIFDSPERYGKGLDWTGYTVHDAANIFRRYLNQLPEPIVPLDFYESFRDPLRSHQAQAVGDMEAQEQDVGDFDHDGAVTTYQRLITELPPLNRQLLLYVLDLLAVFSSKSDLNRMNSANLAAIFQPGIISHPSHDMAPKEYRLSQDVLIFLIENQDNFLFGMSGTAVDAKTVKDMEGGHAPTSAPKVTMGRSASNASASAETLREYGRRNSVSSRHSKTSTGASSPGTPGTPLTTTISAGGVHRSNTVPTKKSPALGSARKRGGCVSPRQKQYGGG